MIAFSTNPADHDQWHRDREYDQRLHYRALLEVDYLVERLAKMAEAVSDKELSRLLNSLSQEIDHEASEMRGYEP